MVEVILKSLFAVATKLAMSAASKPLIEWLLFYVAKQIVNSTKTPHDDIFYQKIKAAYDDQRDYKFNVLTEKSK